MKISPNEFMLCRIPAFGITDRLEDKWKELKDKINESSPAFYETIANLDAEDISKLPEKARFTIWKYFNRAQYRATPFGTFATVVPVPVAKNPTQPIQIGATIYPHYFIDWSEKEKYIQNSREAFKYSKYYLSNSSFYLIGEEIRYICFKNQEFELAAVARMPELEILLEHCRNPSPIRDIHELMQKKFAMDKGNTNQLLMQLMDLQLICTDAYPNITGQDYFSRIDQQPKRLPHEYIIAERKLLDGAFNREYLKQLPELIGFLSQHLQPALNCDLSDFKQAFLQKFEQKEVSLAVAMDPEIGVGYSQLEQQRQQDKLITHIKESRQKGNSAFQIAYGPLQHFLLNQMMGREPIRLENFGGNTSAGTLQLSNSFSLIFHLFKGNPVINQIGGCTANALLGRFTLANQHIEKHARQLATLEKEANPDVIFFDLAYQAEQRVDNVNRRKMLYDYELPILTWPTSAQPLDLNDILVSVCGQEIVLRSKRLNKRLIPRIPSAYNYSRSDLSAYRLLCDLQYQGLYGNLNFRLQDFFPHLDHYPRVSFKDIILSPASWLVPAAFFKEKQMTTAIEQFKDWLAANQIDSVFKAGTSDNILCFDPAKAQDLQAFMLYGKQCCQQELYIYEGLIDHTSFVSDEAGKPYLPQFIASFTHHETIYRPYANIGKPRSSETHPPVLELPGGEWLYFELYLHPSRSNAVLQHFVQPFLKSNQHQLKKWFFIRYNEPSSHLRFRVHLQQKADAYALLSQFKELIANEVKLGLIQDYKIRTYHKETERYGANRMDLVEQYFCADSRYVLCLTGKSEDSEKLYLATLSLLLELYAQAMPDLSHQLAFAKEIAQNFALEMSIDADNFKRINSEFNEFRKRADQLKMPLPKLAKQSLLKHFRLLMESCNNEADKKRLLTDLIHMHINRLFISDQRIHETIIYHYLLRALQTKRALAALPAE